MSLLTERLAGHLQRAGVTVSSPDDDTVRLDGVPLDPKLFSKDHTNVLLRRSPQGALALAVDRDLEYAGSDPVLARAFAASRRRQNWRIMVVPERVHEHHESPAAAALSLLGVTQPEEVRPAGDDGLLARFGRQPANECCPATVGRREQITRLVAAARAWQPRLAVVSGESGSGKTNLLRAAARQLLEARPLQLISIDLAVLMAGSVLEAGREELLARLLEEAAGRDDFVLALENIDRGVLRVPGGYALFANALDRGVRLLGTVLPDRLPALLAAPLTRRMEVVELPEISDPSTLEILQLYAGMIAQKHHVDLKADVLPAVLARSRVVHAAPPARALTLLDAAAGRAAACGATTLEAVHVYLAAADWPELPAPLPIREESA